MPHMKPISLLLFTLLLCFPSTGLCRLEQAFDTLRSMIENSDYIVIATVDHKPQELVMMDGWVRYECRFLYWLKAPAPDPKEKLAFAEKPQPGKKVDPVPLYSLESNGEELKYPPGAPQSKSVLLVDDHEKAYHRLIDAQPQVARALSPLSHPSIYNNYHLLFLRKNEDGKGYVTVGNYQSILPVSPLLDITKLPPQPPVADDNLIEAQSKVKMTLDEEIRFILKDYIAFKEKELVLINKDLEEVLKDKNR